MRPAQPLPLRFFTPAEANAALPAVRSIFEALLEVIREERRRLSKLGTDEEILRRSREALVERARPLLEQLNALGVEVKGVDNGLLDFPALRNGEHVLLCWEVGESKVAWWHSIQTGFSGRQPIEGSGEVCWEWRN